MASERIGIEIEQTVREISMPPDQREAIDDMLGTAGHAANGAPDKQQAIAEAVQSMAVFLARQARHENRRISDAVSSHAQACSMLKASRFAIYMWQYRRHITAVAAVAVGSLSIAHAPWMSRLMDVVVKVYGASTGGAP